MYKNKGFTLIEAMITVGIIGIIATVAWPLYDQQSAKNRRTDGIAALMSSSHAMEQWLDDNGIYNTSDPTLYRASVPNTPPDACRARGFRIDTAPIQSCRGYYQITLAATATSYTLTATAIGVQVDDDDCDTLTIDNLGQKGFSGTGSVKRCWSE